MRTRSVLLLSACLCTLVHPAAAQSLRGSQASMERQNDEARSHDYTFLRTADDVETFVRQGLLVQVPGSPDYQISDEVSFPYARPEVKQFIERMALKYRAACGEPLVVTSLTRPLTQQPWNASHLSVHPTGMAVDLRRSWRTSCRRWLEKTLLDLESRDIVEATRERSPAHYHVTLFPNPYLRYLAHGADDTVTARVDGSARPPRKARAAKRTAVAKAVYRGHGRGKTVRVRRGDNLHVIARRHGVSVAQLKRANHIRTALLRPGQQLQIPVTKSAR